MLLLFVWCWIAFFILFEKRQFRKHTILKMFRLETMLKPCHADISSRNVYVNILFSINYTPYRSQLFASMYSRWLIPQGPRHIHTDPYVSVANITRTLRTHSHQSRQSGHAVALVTYSRFNPRCAFLSCEMRVHIKSVRAEFPVPHYIFKRAYISLSGTNFARVHTAHTARQTHLHRSARWRRR